MRADDDLDGRREQHGELVDHRQIGRIRDDDLERLAVPAVRHEPVPQHKVRGNGAEQLLVDPERVHVDELEPVALGETPRVLELRVPINFSGGARGARGVRRVRRVPGVPGVQRVRRELCGALGIDGHG
ncbi:MAG TPA: hypothetical protein VGP84_23625 [Gemmatimonadaceae bacterium]|nr:hypothetical protein [Gemmatimonadaceae bacterium]